MAGQAALNDLSPPMRWYLSQRYIPNGLHLCSSLANNLVLIPPFIRYLDRVAPWVHYVPIQSDLSDLWDALVFFRGDPGGNGAHESLAKMIGKAGREWSKSFWRKEDMV